MRSIAVITARGGSKRIPKKNIREFCGKPIIAYSIQAALQSGVFHEVMVSTDSREIADIAMSYGAKVPFLRSEDSSNDFATTTDVLCEVLEGYKQKGEMFDLVCCIYPTAPFVTSEKLCKALKQLEDSNAYSLMPVVRFGYPPQRAVVIKGEWLSYQYPKYEKARSQDLEIIYHDCGQFYMCKTGAFYKYKSLVTPKTMPFIVPEEEVQDIDNYSDWNLAEIKYKMFIKRDK